MLELPDPSSPAGPQITGHLYDTGGGPLGLDAELHYDPPSRLGLLSGTLEPRGALPRELRQAIDDLARLHPPDPRGRVPLDLELKL